MKLDADPACSDPHAKVMTTGLSAYLDFLRACAAFMVCIYHYRLEQFSGGHLEWCTWGPDAVVAFFVLSGFVIGFVVDDREKTFSEFLLRRLARLWSVIPIALVITLLLEAAGRKLGARPEVYEPTLGAIEAVRNGASSVFFMNYSWGEFVRVGKNGVLWSVACEWWYYFAFAGVAFLNKRPAWFICAVAFVAAGPNVLLLAPAWLMGFLSYRILSRARQPEPALSKRVAGSLVLTIMIVLWIAADLHKSIHVPAVWGFQLQKSGSFAPDFVFGALIACQIYLVGSLCRSAQRWNQFMEKLSWAKGFANVSFTVYCIHIPLFYFLASTVPYQRSSLWQAGAVFITAIGCAVIVGRCIEPKKKQIYRFLCSISTRDKSTGTAAGQTQAVNR